MPIYEFICQKCGAPLEVMQSYNDKFPERCPKCDGALRRKFSAPLISYKTDGFYETDSWRKE